MSYEYYEMAVTDSNGSQSFSDDKTQVTIRNKGLDTLYFNFDGAATTSHYFLLQGESRSFKIDGITTVQAICDTSDTATLIIEGWGE